MMLILLVASGAFGGLAGILLRVAALASAATTCSGWMPIALRGAAIGSYGVGFVLYAWALRRVDLGTAYPLMVATSMLVVLLFTGMYEHTFKISQVTGGLAILVGIWLVAR